MRSLSRRLAWIVLGTLGLMLVLATLAVGAAWRVENGSGRIALPLPGQVAAIVKLIERTPSGQRGLVLNAINSARMQVSIEDTAPAAADTMPMPALALAVRAYLGALDGRSLKAMIDMSGGNGRPPDLHIDARRAWASHPVRLVVGLKTGGYAVLEMRSALAARLGGLRLSLLVLLGAAVIAAIAWLLLRRQLRPLERLSAAVGRFGANLETSDLPEEGTRELRELTEAFARLQSRIRELVAGRTRMMAAIGHDLGTYLTRLRLRIHYIGDDEERARAEHDIEEMQSLIAGTLALARLDRDVEASQPTDLVALLRQRTQTFAASGAPARFHDPGAALSVPLRPKAMARVFDNLIANALKYGGEADVSIHAASDVIEILVEDRGPGIPETARAAVLEPFYRRDEARNLDEPGFGLGLAIVAEILARHDATITFEDRQGGGLRVRVRIRITDAGEDDQRRQRGLRHRPG